MLPFGTCKDKSFTMVWLPKLKLRPTVSIAKALISYLKIAVACFTIEPEVFAGFTTTSSVLFWLVFMVSVNTIIIKTGSNKSKNGDVLANFFIIGLFIVIIVSF